jgi:hypothetical protein
MRTHILGILATIGLSVGLGPAPAHAQQEDILFTATSANVAEPGIPVRLRILRWSTDEERDRLVTAMNPPPPPPPPAAGEPGGGGRGGGRGGRGGRGGAPAAPLTPIASLTAAIGSAPTIGYVWTTDVTGYSIKYAYRAPLPQGGERIILATERRLGAHTQGWTPVGAAPSNAELSDAAFTLIEIRLDPTGVGEGKASLTTDVMIDTEARTIALENYAAAPAILQGVRPGSAEAAKQ